MTYDELTSALLRTEVERDDARAIARRLAHSIIDFDGPPSAEQADALLAFDARPWAKERA